LGTERRHGITRNPDMARVGVTPVRTSIVFDVEGTLVDCAFEITESWCRALEDFGHHVSDVELHKYSGMDSDDLLNILLPDAASEEREQVKRRQENRYRQDLLPTVRAFPGVKALLKQLRRSGHRIALATSCKADELRDDRVRGKPHPDLIRLAVGRLGARKNATAVGDTPYDAIAASRAGIRTIGTMTGGFSLQELEDAGCYMVIPRLVNLLEFA
jgi:HAD superfamily hydrolase (TIGR01509 family)